MRPCQRWALIGGVGLLLMASQGDGSPVKEVAAKDHALASYGQFTATFELKGQEQTKIIASGSRQIHHGLYVFDGHGNCVAWDDYGTEAREDAAVIFVPPEQGTYLVTVRSFAGRTQPSVQGNLVRLVVR